MKRRHLLGACAGVTSLLGGCVSRVQVPTEDDPARRRSNPVNRGDLVRPQDDSLRRVEDLPLVSLKRAPAPPEGEPQPVESPSDGGELTVTDDGPGVPPKAREHLFEPFVGAARSGGAGLGLVIARDILRAHGGDIELAETSEKGTVFRISLPVEPAAPAAPA